MFVGLLGVVVTIGNVKIIFVLPSFLFYLGSIMLWCNFSPKIWLNSDEPNQGGLFPSLLHWGNNINFTLILLPLFFKLSIGCLNSYQSLMSIIKLLWKIFAASIGPTSETDDTQSLAAIKTHNLGLDTKYWRELRQFMKWAFFTVTSNHPTLQVFSFNLKINKTNLLNIPYYSW